MIWHTHLENPANSLGLIPSFFDEEDLRPAREQVADRYIGGWNPMHGFEMGDQLALLYPGDPPLYPSAAAQLRDEIILVYPYAWIAIIHKDGTFEVARCD